MDAHSRKGMRQRVVKGELLLEPAWSTKERLIDELIIMIADSKREYDQVVGVMRGGLEVAFAIGESLGLPVAIVAAETLGPNATAADKAGQNRICQHSLAKKHSGFGRKVLVVDDLTRSGTTLEAAMSFLRKRFDDQLDVLEAAVLWHRQGSSYKPQFFVDEVVPIQVEGKGEVMPYVFQPKEKWPAVAEIRSRLAKEQASKSLVPPAKPEEKKPEAKKAEPAQAQGRGKKHRRHGKRRAQKVQAKSAQAKSTDNGQPQAQA